METAIKNEEEKKEYFDTPEEFRIFAAIMKQGNNIIKVAYMYVFSCLNTTE